MSVRNILVPGDRVNILALIAGALILYMLYLDGAWWTIYAVGDNPTFTAIVAPYKIGISILGKPVNVPIIPYVELSGFLTYLFIGLGCIIGGLIPNKEISKSLIGFRALSIPIITIFTIYLGLSVAKNYVNVAVPIFGSTELQLQIPYRSNVIKTYTLVNAEFTYTYYIALTAGILAALGRILTGKKE